MAIIPFDDRPRAERRRFPIVVVVLVAINVLVFLYQLTLSPQALTTFVLAWGMTPAEITTGQDLPPAIPVPVYLTLITSMFIHGGIFHLLINMIFLWVFGDNVEDALGRATFLVYYLVAGILGSLAFAFLFPDTTIPAVGASGAVAGVLAGYLILFPRAEVRTLLFFGPFLTVGRIAALVLIGIWFILQLWEGVALLNAQVQTGGIAYAAHVGGFLAGAIMLLAIRRIRHQPLGNARGAVWIGPTFRNWLILLGTLVVLLAVTAFLADAGLVTLAIVLQTIILLGAAILALVDAWRRITGRPSLLGSGTRFGRILAIVQILIALGLMVTALTVIGL